MEVQSFWGSDAGVARPRRSLRALVDALPVFISIFQGCPLVATKVENV